MLVNIGKGITLDVDATALPANVMAHVVMIGLRNVLMDSHASITKEEAGDDMVAQSRAVAEKKLAAMMAGEIRVSNAREGDPVRAEAIRLATAAITEKARREKKKLDAKTLRELAVANIGPFMEMAAKRVAELKDRPSVDIELPI